MKETSEKDLFVLPNPRSMNLTTEITESLLHNEYYPSNHNSICIELFVLRKKTENVLACYVTLDIDELRFMVIDCMSLYISSL